MFSMKCQGGLEEETDLVHDNLSAEIVVGTAEVFEIVESLEKGEVGFLVLRVLENVGES